VAMNSPPKIVTFANVFMLGWNICAIDSCFRAVRDQHILAITLVDSEDFLAIAFELAVSI
jgi:hypothetical protein